MTKQKLLKQNYLKICISVLLGIIIVPIAFAQQKTQPLVATQPAGKIIELKYATIRGPTDINAERWEIPLSNEIEKQTGGRVKVTHYWSEALGKGRDQFNMVKNGLADMSDFPGAYTPGKFLLSEVGNLPFAAKDINNIQKAMNQMLEKGLFKSAWGEVEVLAWNMTPFYQILFRKDKPLTFEDLAGKKVRTPGGYMTEFLKVIKAVPVNIAPAEAYQAWEKGLVEGWMHPAGAFRNYKLYELSNRCMLKTNAMIMANAAVIFNKEKMASLDPEIQKIIHKVVKDYQEVYDQAGIYQDELSFKIMAEKGVEVYNLTDPEWEKMKKASIEVWRKYISDVNATGGDGKAIVNEYINILKGLGEKPYYTP